MRCILGRALALTSGLLIALAAGPSAAQPAGVRMLDNSFSPQVLEVEPDQDVAFTNDGAVAHNIIAEDGTFSSVGETGDNVQPGDAWTLTAPDTDGVVAYYCSLHATPDDAGGWQGMVGALVVGDAELVEERDSGSSAPREWTGVTRAVPQDYPTIQSGVDAADPGDLVLVSPGSYREAVSVTTPGLTIRGTDRNAVILEGELTRENGILVTADGVAIENMTARGYTVNGFFWNGVTGYRGTYLTAIDDWVYGIYAFDSVDGLLSHSYASGSWDAGFYIGQCDPCDAVITDVVAEFNGLGYSGTNSSGNIWILNSEWRHNVAGIAPNTLDSELLPPVNNVVVAGNYIHDNGEEGRAPNRNAEWSAYGNGVVLAGARESVVRNNLIVNNATSGVLVVTNIDANVWPSGDNRVHDNVIMGSGRSDLALGGPLEQGSCFADNEASTTLPWLLEELHACDGINLPLTYGLAASSDSLGRIAQATMGQNPQLEHGDAPKPDLAFAQLPGGADAPVVPAVDVFAGLDLDPGGISTPTLPAGVEVASRRPVLFGVALDGGFWPLAFGALLWWIPMGTWLLGGAWVLWRVWRSERTTVGRLGWTVGTVGVPVLGVVGYTAIGERAWSRRRRLTVALGGLLLWLVVVVAALVIGGVL